MKERLVIRIFSDVAGEPVGYYICENASLQEIGASSLDWFYREWESCLKKVARKSKDWSEEDVIKEMGELGWTLEWMGVDVPEVSF